MQKRRQGEVDNRWILGRPLVRRSRPTRHPSAASSLHPLSRPVQFLPSSPWALTCATLLLGSFGAQAARPDADQPVRIEARSLTGTADQEARAEGEVELRQGGLLLKADRLTYRSQSDRAVAEGRVSVSREGSTFRGPLLELTVQSFEGFFLQPEFDIGRTKTGGRAQRIDFAGSSRFQATEPG